MPTSLPKTKSKSNGTSKPAARRFPWFQLVVLAVLLVAVAGAWWWYQRTQQEFARLTAEKDTVTLAKEALAQKLDEVSMQLTATAAELQAVKSEDQFVKNRELEAEIRNIQTTFQQTVSAYEKILDLRGDGARTQALDAQFSTVLSLLSRRNYASASTQLRTLQTNIQTLQTQLAGAVEVPANVTSSNTPPDSGYSRQAVDTDVGRFLVDIVGADLGSTRVVVETASAGDCADNCPVASLADYVSRAGGFAGINGPYFCPAEYPSCAGKKNSFDTLLMNKNKVYFNSGNNVYSTVPAFIFSSSARLVGASSEWGRDTGPDSVIASQPMLLSGGEVRFGGSGDPKQGSRGSRSFIATKGNRVYIGVVRGATVAEVARVLKAMGLENALNLDSGGSTAFYAGGRYVAGPGRQTPFGIVLVRR